MLPMFSVFVFGLVGCLKAIIRWLDDIFSLSEQYVQSR